MQRIVEKLISTHTLTWSVTDNSTGKARQIKDFNSHAHVERDQTALSCQSLLRHFNSHAHVERDMPAHVLLVERRNFNSHAHVERDDVCFFYVVLYAISTHTLTWSVTIIVVWKRAAMHISTHTLTWSVTIAEFRKIPVMFISTHTLTWSVTTLG